MCYKAKQQKADEKCHISQSNYNKTYFKEKFAFAQDLAHTIYWWHPYKVWKNIKCAILYQLSLQKNIQEGIS